MTAAPGDGFLPSVTKNAWLPGVRTLRIAQHLADEGLARHRRPDEATAITDLHGLYACRTPVERHQDLDGARPGMHVHGLVIRSDGHRLHSQKLVDAGCAEGLLLEAGNFYDLDPYDPHWTTIDGPSENGQLVFYVEGEMPDERTRAEIVGDLAFFLSEELALLDPRPRPVRTRSGNNPTEGKTK